MRKFIFITGMSDAPTDRPASPPVTAAVLTAPVADRIAQAYAGLSDAHRRAADFVLSQPFDAATMTIDELAKAAGVSITTANRFVRALGFDGYAEFRAELVDALKATMAPVERLRAGRCEPATAGAVVAESLAEDLDNLRRTLDALPEQACERVVALILAARCVFTLGFGSSAYVAAFAANGLDPFCRDARFVGGEGGAEQAVRRLMKLEPGDLFIVFSLPRYSRDTVEITRMARARGATVVAVTDGPTSPLVPLADLTLYAVAERRLLASSAAAAFTLAEALVSAVAHQREDALKAYTDLTEQVMPYLHAGRAQAGPRRG